jgi:hypothetical protein
MANPDQLSLLTAEPEPIAAEGPPGSRPHRDLTRRPLTPYDRTPPAWRAKPAYPPLPSHQQGDISILERRGHFYFGLTMEIKLSVKLFCAARRINQRNRGQKEQSRLQSTALPIVSKHLVLEFAERKRSS